MPIALAVVEKVSHYNFKTMNKFTEDDLREELKTQEYEYGFYTDIESDTFPKGLNEDIVRAISKKKKEPQWMTDWRLEAFRIWEQMDRSEERRVGKECRSRWSPDH